MADLVREFLEDIDLRRAELIAEFKHRQETEEDTKRLAIYERILGVEGERYAWSGEVDRLLEEYGSIGDIPDELLFGKPQ